MRVLLERLRLLWAGGDVQRLPVPDEALDAFIAHCSEKVGDAYFRTPRETIRAFLGLLAVLDQNPGTLWTSLLGTVQIAADHAISQSDEGGDLANFVIAQPETNDPASSDGLATFH